MGSVNWSTKIGPSSQKRVPTNFHWCRWGGWARTNSSSYKFIVGFLYKLKMLTVSSARVTFLPEWVVLRFWKFYILKIVGVGIVIFLWIRRPWKAKSSERERREKKEKLGKFTVFGRLVVSSGSIVGPSRVCALPWGVAAKQSVRYICDYFSSFPFLRHILFSPKGLW